MGSRNSNYWMSFFLDANLPQSVATRYAVTFTDHRIQENMLGDLTKDMLYDMGIKTMGDVIAILKHAKEVNDEKIQLQLLGKSNLAVSTSKPKMQVSSISKEPISGPSVSSSTSGSTIKIAKRTAVDDDSIGPMKVRRVINSVANSSRITNTKTSSNNPIQTKVTFNSIKTGSSTSMRLGNTHQDSETRKVSVFNRLGDNEPTLNKLKVSVREPKVTRTITGLKDKTPTVVKYSQPTSVKDRLGVNLVSRGSNSNRKITNLTIKPKQSSPQQSRTKISLKKSIFDRLGTKSF